MTSPDRWLFLFLKSAPCACRCKHCDFVVSAFPSLPFKRTVEFVQPFIEGRDNNTALYRNMAVLFGDAPLNYPNLSDGISYLKQHHIEGWRSIPANGFRIRRPEEWQPFLKMVRQAGTEILEFTLYGQRNIHDWFAGRQGDFDAIHALAHNWCKLDGKTMWSVVAHKNNLSEIASIRAEILAAYGETCHVSLWSYLGHGVTIEDLRLEVTDLDQLDETVQADLQSFKPECEWVTELQTLAEAPYPQDPRVIRVVVDNVGKGSIPYTPPTEGHQGMTIGQLPFESINAFFESWTRQYALWREAYPSLGPLCQHFGQVSGTRLYDLASIRAKWCHLYDLFGKAT